MLCRMRSLLLKKYNDEVNSEKCSPVLKDVHQMSYMYFDAYYLVSRCQEKIIADFCVVFNMNVITYYLILVNHWWNPQTVLSLQDYLQFSKQIWLLFNALHFPKDYLYFSFLLQVYSKIFSMVVSFLGHTNKVSTSE